MDNLTTEKSLTAPAAPAAVSSIKNANYGAPISAPTSGNLTTEKSLTAPAAPAAVSSIKNVNYGAPISAPTSGNFPAIGSNLGPYFITGKLGKGTFCSIHKCINMHYHHTRVPTGTEGRSNKKNLDVTQHSNRHRLVAAKVEIGEFKHSGVLQGEASVLNFLDDSLPSHTVPTYMGHYVSSDRDKNNNNVTSAIIMEYLTGQDMHVIRDWAARPRRRISIEDAVYLTADVMLPLLRKMHHVGIIHRDVKPSNVVRVDKKLFCMVDFGLSKSIVVPGESALADPELFWNGPTWMGQIQGSNVSPCYRKKRLKADFRGTSMYASVRVHQLNDYCPRDDIWSLLYVFCDLASGGLPWMSHAANRDREACKIIKERIHGLEAKADGEILIDTRRLLMGDEYHVALFKKRKGNLDSPDLDQDTLVDDDDDPSLPRPLSLSEDKSKVGLLTKAFEHLKGLEYSDIPDYDLIESCLQGFLTPNSNSDEKDEKKIDQNSSVPSIDWELLAETYGTETDSKKFKQENLNLPTWEWVNEQGSRLDSSIFAEDGANTGNNPEENTVSTLFGEAADMTRLPLELRFRVAQMDYNTSNDGTIESYLALRDWLNVALPLLYCTWDSKRYEKGGHRSNNDGYRREFFLRLVNKCLECAATFKSFRDMKIMYDDDDNAEQKISTAKRRRLVQINNMSSHESGSENSNKKVSTELLLISKVMFELRMTKKAEDKLSRAPPPRLSFGS